MKSVFLISCLSFTLVACTGNVLDKRAATAPQPQSEAEVAPESLDREPDAVDAPDSKEQADAQKMLAECLGVPQEEVQMDRNVSLSLAEQICDTSVKAGVSKGVQDDSEPLEL